MYELIILSLLMRGTVHGYVIAGVVNDVVGPRARASNGRIYPLLAKLAGDGLIEVHRESTSHGGRVARSFAITASGRDRFHALMLDTTSNPREYRDLFTFKVTAFDHITRDERIALLEHYRAFAEAHIAHQRGQARDIADATTYGHTHAERRRFASVFDHLVTTWTAERDWADGLLKRGEIEQEFE